MKCGILALMLFCSSAVADYRLDVWDKRDWFNYNNYDTEPFPLATRRFIAFSDCREYRQWLLSLMNRLQQEQIVVTCQYYQ